MPEPVDAALVTPVVAVVDPLVLEVVAVALALELDDDDVLVDPEPPAPPAPSAVSPHPLDTPVAKRPAPMTIR